MFAPKTELISFDTAASQPSAPAPDLASEILEGPALNRKAHGLANANAIALTVIGAALKFILDARGPRRPPDGNSPTSGKPWKPRSSLLTSNGG